MASVDEIQELGLPYWKELIAMNFRGVNYLVEITQQQSRVNRALTQLMEIRPKKLTLSKSWMRIHSITHPRNRRLHNSKGDGLMKTVN